MVRFLVLEMNAKVNINWPYSYQTVTPLMCAIFVDNLQMAKLLVEELGADVNFKVSLIKDGSSPFLALHMAIFYELK